MDLNITNILLLLILCILLTVHWESLVAKTNWLIEPIIKILLLLCLICFVGFVVWGAFHFGFTDGKPHGSDLNKAIWFFWFLSVAGVALGLLSIVGSFLDRRSESFMRNQIERYRQNKKDGKNPWS